MRFYLERLKPPGFIRGECQSLDGEITEEVRFEKGYRAGDKTNPLATVTPIFG